MPLHWTVESLFKMITVVADGDVGRGDLQTYFEMVSGANIVGWRKLFDARAARLVFTSQDVNELGVWLRAADAVQMVGALAFVMPEIETPELMRLLGFLAAAKRPMRIFHQRAPAQKWIMSVGSSGV